MVQVEHPYLRAGDVARLLKVSPKTVARWSTEGKIPFMKTLGGHRRYDGDVILRIAERLNHEDVQA